MIRRNLLKATLLTTVIATLLVSSACGSKNTASTNNDTAQSVQATTAKTVTKETEKNSDNNNTETTAETNAENVENTEVVVSENNDNTSEEQEIIVADNNNISKSNDGNSYVEDNNNNNNNEVIANDTPNVDIVDNTPAPAPADTTPVIDNTPVINEDNNTSVDNNIASNNTNTGNNNGYDFPTVDGPNGPMYAEKYNGHIPGEDVNQGANVECPYTMKQVTTRYFETRGEWSVREGYYYIAVDEYGDEIPLSENPFHTYYNQLGYKNCIMSKVGTFSCGDVWFCASND